MRPLARDLRNLGVQRREHSLIDIQLINLIRLNIKWGIPTLKNFSIFIYIMLDCAEISFLFVIGRLWRTITSTAKTH